VEVENFVYSFFEFHSQYQIPEMHGDFMSRSRFKHAFTVLLFDMRRKKWPPCIYKSKKGRPQMSVGNCVSRIKKRHTGGISLLPPVCPIEKTERMTGDEAE